MGSDYSAMRERGVCAFGQGTQQHPETGSQRSEWEDTAGCEQRTYRNRCGRAAQQGSEDSGAGALMVLPPYYLKTDGDGLMHYFESISNAVNIPIMVQDAPLLTAVPMPAARSDPYGKEIAHIEYAKIEAPPTPPKVTAPVRAAGLTIFAGLNGQFMIEEIRRGARGVMPGSDMIGMFVP